MERTLHTGIKWYMYVIHGEASIRIIKVMEVGTEMRIANFIPPYLHV